MIKRFVYVIIFLVLVMGGLIAWHHMASKKMRAYVGKMVSQTPVISVGTAQKIAWSPSLTAIGSMVAVNGVDVSTEVAGRVTAIRFKSGQLVKQGQSLIQLDDSIERQALLNDKAKLDLNKIQYKQQRQLFSQHAVAKISLDQAMATLKQQKAQVAQSQQKVDQKNIKAPFDGKIGIRQVNLGEYVNPGAKLVNLQNINPLFVNFTLPEEDLSILHTGQALTITVDSHPGQVFKGSVTAINSAVDEQTRTIQVQGTVSNQKNMLYPGLYAKVIVMMPTKEEVIVVPQTAVAFTTYGDTVYVIQNKNDPKTGKNNYIALQRFVQTGPHIGDKIVISKGIQTGDTVVISGQLKLYNGAVVDISNKDGVTAKQSAVGSNTVSNKTPSPSTTTKE